jgi:hypothetical protein
VAGVFDLLLDYLETKCPRKLSIAPVLSSDEGGNKSLRIDFCYSGSDSQEIEGLLSLSKLIRWQNVKSWEFRKWQSAFDAHFLPPMRGYWKDSYVKHISPAIRQQLLESFAKAPSRSCSILIWSPNRKVWPVRRAEIPHAST